MSSRARAGTRGLKSALGGENAVVAVTVDAGRTEDRGEAVQEQLKGLPPAEQLEIEKEIAELTGEKERLEKAIAEERAVLEKD